MQRDRSYVPGPLPTDMGYHTPASLRLAITNWQANVLIKSQRAYEAYQLLEQETRMTPKVPVK